MWWGMTRCFRGSRIRSDWSIDDAVWGYGAPVSALTINDNQIKVTVTPAAVAGQPANGGDARSGDALVLHAWMIRLTTGGRRAGDHVQIERALGSKVLRVFGGIAVDSQSG